MKISLDTKYNEGQTVWEKCSIDSFVIDGVVIKSKNNSFRIFYSNGDQLHEESQLFSSKEDAYHEALKKINIQHIPIAELEKELIEILPSNLLKKLNEFRDKTLFSFLHYEVKILLRFRGIGKTTIMDVNNWLLENYQVRLK